MFEPDLSMEYPKTGPRLGQIPPTEVIIWGEFHSSGWWFRKCPFGRKPGVQDGYKGGGGRLAAKSTVLSQVLTEIANGSYPWWSESL